MKKQIVFDAPFKQYIGIDYLGDGGAGQVYRATDDNNNIYAIKRIKPDKINRKDLKRFKNEVDFCSRKVQPNILEVLDSGNVVDGKLGIPFYVMPLYAASFRKLLDEGIPPEKVLYYFNQLLNGVEAAHFLHVVHRDLKPENVLYDQAQDRLLIADFGIAHFEVEDLYAAAETSPHDRLANFQYAAPEQRARGVKVDHRADIYALGLILNEMFTRLIPYGTGYKTIGEVAPIYAYLDELVAEMLNQSVERRTNSIEDVKRQLIGRGDEFARLQRLNALKQTVVPVSDIDDPLISNPPTIIDANYIRGVVHIDLSQPINDKWVRAICSMGSFSYVIDKRPENFDIYGNRASIRAEEQDAKQVVDFFKAWLPVANSLYAQMIRNEKQEEEERQRKELRKEIEELERQKRVKASLRI